MPAANVVRLTCNAVYSDGSPLLDNIQLITKASLQPMPLGPGSDNYQVVELRIAVPKAQAEELLDGISSGVAELYVEGMKTFLEQAS